MASKLLVTAHFQVQIESNGTDINWFFGTVAVDGGAEESRVARIKWNVSDASSGVLMATQSYVLSLSAGAHTVRMRAKKEGTTAISCQEEGTGMLYQMVAVA